MLKLECKISAGISNQFCTNHKDTRTYNTPDSTSTIMAPKKQSCKKIFHTIKRGQDSVSISQRDATMIKAFAPSCSDSLAKHRLNTIIAKKSKQLTAEELLSALSVIVHNFPQYLQDLVEKTRIFMEKLQIKELGDLWSPWEEPVSKAERISPRKRLSSSPIPEARVSKHCASPSPTSELSVPKPRTSPPTPVNSPDCLESESDSGSDNSNIPVPQKRSRFIIRSGSELEEEETETEPGYSKKDEKKRRDSWQKKKKKRRRVMSSSDSESDDEEEKDNETSVTTNDDDGDNKIFEVCYRHVDNAFAAKFPGTCKMPGCKEIFLVGTTKIIGVWFKNEPQKKKPKWICAKHDFENSKVDREENEKLDEEEQTQSDEGFITSSNESEEEDNIQSAMDKITKDLRKETPEDEKNKNNYIEELSLHQLEIHSFKNRAIHTRGKNRFLRHMRSARRF